MTPPSAPTSGKQTSWVRRAVALVSLASVTVFAQSAGMAQQGGGSPGDALPYSRGFLITGDYATGGVDLREETHIIQNGFSTAPISMGGVPPNADILAAYVYWETITTGGDGWKTEAAGVKFRGYDLDLTNVLSVKRTAQPSSGAACFGSGSLTRHMFRGDVLRFLPVKVDSAGKPTGKRLVNSADLAAQGLDAHTVTLPVRDGNAVPETAGASLVVVYRDPNPNAPLKKVVIYDGNVTKPNLNTALGSTMKGFYGSSVNKSAKSPTSSPASAEQPSSVLVRGPGDRHRNRDESVHRGPGVAAVVGQPDDRRQLVDESRKLRRRVWRDRSNADLPLAGQRGVRLRGVGRGGVQHRRQRPRQGWSAGCAGECTDTDDRLRWADYFVFAAGCGRPGAAGARRHGRGFQPTGHLHRGQRDDGGGDDHGSPAPMQDIQPGHGNPMWFEADALGTTTCRRLNYFKLVGVHSTSAAFASTSTWATSPIRQLAW